MFDDMCVYFYISPIFFLTDLSFSYLADKQNIKYDYSLRSEKI